MSTMIKGQAKTWEEPIGITRATFCQGISEVRTGLRHVPATLVIHDKEGERVYTEAEVVAIMYEINNVCDTVRMSMRVAEVLTKHNITLP